MTDEQFADLVHRLEARARNQPASYGRQVLGLAMLGNLYLALTILLIAALLVAAIASIKFLRAFGVKLALVIAVFLWTIVKSLWVKLPAPSGREIERAQAPALFAMLDELRSALGAPRFHHVLLSDDFNAAVTQVPRLGIFGWPRNYLLLGLPLMKVLSREQFKAVLAHEYGHLAGGHARLSNWIYRQRQRWGKLLDALSGYEGRGSFLFLPFLRWYTPYFNAFSFPLARANEYAADAASARLTSPDALASALTGVAVAGTYLSERYWPAIHEQAQDAPQPGFMPYAALSTRLANDFPTAPTDTWLATALERATTLDDTHPALAERIAALGVAARVTPAANEDTADHLLGAQLADITAEFDRQWMEAIAPAWTAHHAEVQRWRAQLAALNTRHDAGEELTLQEAFERATLTAGVGRDTVAALAQWRALCERAPDESLVRLRYGSLLARTDPAAGAALMEQAMASNANLTIEACAELRDLAWAAGEKTVAADWHRRMVERQVLEHAAAVERDEVSTHDTFDTHGLDAETLAALRGALQGIASIKAAYLVRKRCAHLPDRPLFVLGYTVGGWPERRRRARAAEALAAIQSAVEFPGETLIVNIQSRRRGLAGPLKRVTDSKLL